MHTHELRPKNGSAIDDFNKRVRDEEIAAENATRKERHAATLAKLRQFDLEKTLQALDEDLPKTLRVAGISEEDFDVVLAEQRAAIDTHCTGPTVGRSTGPGAIGGGTKHDAGKPDWTLFPFDAYEGVVRVLEFGAKKYGRSNFRGGFKYSRLLAAAFRHIIEYSKGARTDPESGLSHLDHAACMIAFLRAQELGKYGEDDLNAK